VTAASTQSKGTEVLIPRGKICDKQIVDVATTVFVYGTLKRGCRNHRRLESAPFLGEAWTQPLYLLLDCGSYPGLVLAGSGHQGQAIYGELYRVEDRLLADLDVFEDAPGEFIRAAIELESGLSAQAYFYRRETVHRALYGAVWVDR
jgi:gamma-glutamylaminecyclotransferase